MMMVIMMKKKEKKMGRRKEEEEEDSNSKRTTKKTDRLSTTCQALSYAPYIDELIASPQVNDTGTITNSPILQMRKMRHEKLSKLSGSDRRARTQAIRLQRLCSYPLPPYLILSPKEALIPGHHCRERRGKNSFLWTLVP